MSKPTLAEFIEACQPENDQERDLVVRYWQQWDGRPWSFMHVRDVVRTLTGWARWTSIITTAGGEDMTPYHLYNAQFVKPVETPAEPEQRIEPKTDAPKRYVVLKS